jgi:DNA-binding XRE family transcriptional regulator
MSQARLADIVGVTTRQIARYEAGEQQPVLSVAAAIANALDVPLAELAEEPSQHPDLKGTWWSGWETIGKDRAAIVAVDEIVIHQHLETIRLAPEERRSSAPPGPDWRGELRMSNRRVLIGSFRGDDERAETKGTLYYLLDAEGSRAHGRWVGMGTGGSISSGWVSLARSPQEARQIIESLATDRAAETQGEP